MNHLYTVAQLRVIERAAGAALPAGALMQRAGQAAANVALALLAGLPKERRSVLLLAGPGNNGGDALAAAANLAHTNAGVDVAILHLPGTTPVSPETADALARATGSQARFIDALPEREPGLVVDGLFGIGLARPLEGAARLLVESLNEKGWHVLALDVPSGLDADTGTVVGPGGVAVVAERTLTFIADKPGLHTLTGRDHAGEVQVETLGVAAPALLAPTICLNSTALFAEQLHPRRHNSHKGTFGDVMIVGGAAGMAGAPVLAARAALYAGAGRVMVASVASFDAGGGFDSLHPEIMFRQAADQQFGHTSNDETLVIGPGLGGSAQAMGLLAEALQGDATIVLDADGLNLVAASVDLAERLRARAARGYATLMTPHPLEAARLMGIDTAEVQRDRLATARALAERFQAVVVLKGSGSIIAAPDEITVVNANGNPGLATGGSGDTLAGLCGALLAQGWPARQAACGAVWLHGAAADRLVNQGQGPIGLTAGELPLAVRSVLNELVAAGANGSGRS
jgi:hydroxyethylthiazole kinase-like uncharacterized protein yjeF